MLPQFGRLQAQLALLLSTSTGARYRRNIGYLNASLSWIGAKSTKLVFSALICTLCSPNSKSRPDWTLDASGRPISPSDAFTSSTSMVSPTGTSLGITTPLKLLGLSLNFQVQAPRHLPPTLVSNSTSFCRLGWILQMIQVWLFLVVAVQENVPPLALTCPTVFSCAVYSRPFSAHMGEGRAPSALLLLEALRLSHSWQCNHWCCTSSSSSLWCWPPRSILVHESAHSAFIVCLNCFLAPLDTNEHAWQPGATPCLAMSDLST